MKIDSFSIEGIHYSNEDSLSVHQLTPNKAVAVLADGMGGLTFGKEAADLIISTITAFICEHVERLPIQELLGKALEYADETICQKSMGTHSKMGAAVAIAFIDDNNIHYTWQGNVRIYLFNHDKAEQLTTDHILDAGYGKYLLTRCIKGAGLRTDIPYQCREVNAGNVLLLCTDGFYKQTEVNQMSDTISLVNKEYEDDASFIKIVL